MKPGDTMGLDSHTTVGPFNRRAYDTTRIFQADVGTRGRVIADERARVLNEQDKAIDGLLQSTNSNDIFCPGSDQKTTVNRH